MSPALRLAKELAYRAQERLGRDSWLYVREENGSLVFEAIRGLGKGAQYVRRELAVPESLLKAGDSLQAFCERAERCISECVKGLERYPCGAGTVCEGRA